MAVALVLLSAFLHAAWNALLKRENDKDAAGVVVVAIAAAVGAVVAIPAALITGRPPFPDGGAIGYTLAAGVFEAGYFVTLALALARAPLGPPTPSHVAAPSCWCGRFRRACSASRSECAALSARARCWLAWCWSVGSPAAIAAGT